MFTISLYLIFNGLPSRRGNSSVQFSFLGFGSLRKWMSNSDDISKEVISLDGKTWKRWDAVNKHLKAGLSLAQAFAKARPVKIK